MRITMVGSGFVGLVSGACFAQFGHDVVCVDKDPSKIEKLKQGVMPIYEPGLDKLVLDNMKAGRLSFSTNLPDSVSGADAVFIAVGTPSRRGDGHADLSYVYEAAREIAGAQVERQVFAGRHGLDERAGDVAERRLVGGRGRAAHDAPPKTSTPSKRHVGDACPTRIAWCCCPRNAKDRNGDCPASSPMLGRS